MIKLTTNTLSVVNVKNKLSNRTRSQKFKKYLPLHLILLPGVILLLIYSYGPMLGLVMAFQKFSPSLGFTGSKFVGLDNFIYVFNMPDTMQVLWNTIYIAFIKIATGIIVPVIFALLLNEVANKNLKKSIQTMIYLPFFLSWVVLGGIIKDILSPSTGIANSLLGLFGIESIYFLASTTAFPWILIISNLWKEFGYGTVIYLAALTSIDPTLYEASTVDGAGRWKQTLHVTLPGLTPIIVMMTVLSLGNVLNAGFEQVFNLYSPIVYKTGDIIDTYVYRIGLEQAQFSVGAAVGFFKSVVSFMFVAISYWLAKKLVNYRVF